MTWVGFESVLHRAAQSCSSAMLWFRQWTEHRPFSFLLATALWSEGPQSDCHQMQPAKWCHIGHSLSLVFNPFSSLFFFLILLISLHFPHSLYLSRLSPSLLGHAYARWPFQWMVFWPPLVIHKRTIPCWALMTSSTLEVVPTLPTCPDHQSATTSWAALKMWVTLSSLWMYCY